MHPIVPRAHLLIPLLPVCVVYVPFPLNFLSMRMALLENMIVQARFDLMQMM